MRPSDHVQIKPRDALVFVIVDVDEAGAKATIGSVIDSPGRYPFPTALADLVDADSGNG